MISFIGGKAFIIILFTLLLYVFTISKMEVIDKYLYAFVFFFIFLYSGIGGALEGVYDNYIYYYVIYLVTLSIVLRYSNVGMNFTTEDDLLCADFINRRAKLIIILYFFVFLLEFIFPRNILANLVSPSYSLLDHDFMAVRNENAIEQIIYLVKSFISPLFYWSLYAYKDKKYTVWILLIFNLYLMLAHDGYLARNEMLQAFLIAFVPYYLSQSAKTQKRLVVLSIIAIPIFLFGFYALSLLRHGEEVGGLSVSQGAGLLIEQEIGYPLLFEYCIQHNYSLLSDYFIWILLLPLPGFLKFGLGDMPINRVFSTVVTGLNPWDRGFSVVLPGLVGEAACVMGPSLYFIHAILLGIVMKFTFNTLKKIESLQYVLIYYMVHFSFILGRAGTAGTYPAVAKGLLIILVIVAILRRKNRQMV